MIAEKILELKHLGLSAKKISKHLDLSMYTVMKHYDFERFEKSYCGKGGKAYKKKDPRKTDVIIKKNQLENDLQICKEWILKSYELSLKYETPALEIYRNYEYYIINVYNLKNNANLNPVSAGKFRQIMNLCGFSNKKKKYAEVSNFHFNVERKAVL